MTIPHARISIHSSLLLLLLIDSVTEIWKHFVPHERNEMEIELSASRKTKKQKENANCRWCTQSSYTQTEHNGAQSVYWFVGWHFVGMEFAVKFKRKKKKKRNIITNEKPIAIGLDIQRRMGCCWCCYTFFSLSFFLCTNRLTVTLFNRACRILPIIFYKMIHVCTLYTSVVHANYRRKKKNIIIMYFFFHFSLRNSHNQFIRLRFSHDLYVINNCDNIHSDLVRDRTRLEAIESPELCCTKKKFKRIFDILFKIGEVTSDESYIFLWTWILGHCDNGQIQCAIIRAGVEYVFLLYKRIPVPHLQSIPSGDTTPEDRAN